MMDDTVEYGQVRKKPRSKHKKSRSKRKKSKSKRKKSRSKSRNKPRRSRRLSRHSVEAVNNGKRSIYMREHVLDQRLVDDRRKLNHMINGPNDCDAITYSYAMGTTPDTHRPFMVYPDKGCHVLCVSHRRLKKWLMSKKPGLYTYDATGNKIGYHTFTLRERDQLKAQYRAVRVLKKLPPLSTDQQSLLSSITISVARWLWSNAPSSFKSLVGTIRSWMPSRLRTVGTYMGKLLRWITNHPILTAVALQIYNVLKFMVCLYTMGTNGLHLVKTWMKDQLEPFREQYNVLTDMAMCAVEVVSGTWSIFNLTNCVANLFESTFGLTLGLNSSVCSALAAWIVPQTKMSPHHFANHIDFKSMPAYDQIFAPVKRILESKTERPELMLQALVNLRVTRELLIKPMIPRLSGWIRTLVNVMIPDGGKMPAKIDSLINKLDRNSEKVVDRFWMLIMELAKVQQIYGILQFVVMEVVFICKCCLGLGPCCFQPGLEEWVERVETKAQETIHESANINQNKTPTPFQPQTGEELQEQAKKVEEMKMKIPAQTVVEDPDQLDDAEDHEDDSAFDFVDKTP